MLVPNTVKLTIITADGVKCELNVEATAGIHFIKRRAIEALYSSDSAGQEPHSVKRALYYKLVHPGSIKALKDESTLYDEQITGDCQLLLVKKRLDESRFSRYGAAASREKLAGKTPDIAMIREATSHLTKKGSVTKHRDSNQDDFQRVLKRILITLVESAQNILALNPEAAQIFQEAQVLMNKESDNAENASEEPPIPKETISQLTDMGFSEDRAILALRKSKMSVSVAMEWLLVNPEQAAKVSSSPPSSNSSQEDNNPAVTLTPADDAGSADNAQSLGAVPKRQSKAQSILDSFRTYKKRKFVPNAFAMTSLIDMGFEEADVKEALRITENDQEAACDWLLSDRRQRQSEDSLEEGIDPTSHLYQSIINNPVVQLGLNNPRSLLAFLHMLENGTNTLDWLKDPDIGPLLLQISRIYSAEQSDCSFPLFSENVSDS